MRQDDTVQMRPKTPRKRDRDFLRWAKTQHAPCCICGDAPGNELHHWGRGGMSYKSDDYEVCRVCRTCHMLAQGMRRHLTPDNARYPARAEHYARWADMLEDSHKLLVGWICRGK